MNIIVFFFCITYDRVRNVLNVAQKLRAQILRTFECESALSLSLLFPSPLICESDCVRVCVCVFEFYMNFFLCVFCTYEIRLILDFQSMRDIGPLSQMNVVAGDYCKYNMKFGHPKFDDTKRKEKGGKKGKL